MMRYTKAHHRVSIRSLAGLLCLGLSMACGPLGDSSLNVPNAETRAPLTCGEPSVLSSSDSGNAGFLIASSASLSQAATIQSLSFYTKAGAGKIRLGLYDATGPRAGPGAKKAETAELSLSGAGWYTAAVTTQVALSPGTYWLAFVANSNSLVAASDSTGSTKYYRYPYGALPAMFSTAPSSLTEHFSMYATLGGTGGGGSGVGGGGSGVGGGSGGGSPLSVLSVSKSGAGTISSNPAGIDCGTTCTASFASGSSVRLAATAMSGYAFSGWSGDCSGAGACVVAMSAARSVTATFTSTNGNGAPAPTVVAHTIRADPAPSGTSPMTTPAINTPSSGSLILVQVLTQNSGTFRGLEDNKGNTYVAVGGAQTYVGGAGSLLFKCENATGGTGHTFSLNKTPGYETNEATLYAVVISGVPASGAVGNWSYQSSSAYSGTAISTTAANSLVVSFWGPADYTGSMNNYVAPSGWTRLDQTVNSANTNTGANAFTVVPASGTSVNATWSSNLALNGEGSSMWLVEVKP